MRTYFYKARSRGGKLVTGRLEAKDRRKAVDLISERALCVVAIKEVQMKSIDCVVGFFAKKVGARELALMCHQFAALTQVGIPMLQCFNILIQQCNHKTLQHTLRKVAANLEEGMSLADALRPFPQVFPPLMINMVESGEVSGTLAQVLNRLAVHMQKDYELREKIKSVMTYPAAVLAVAVLSAVALMTLVVPKFVLLLNELMAPIPLTTRCVVRCGEILRDYWYLAGLLGAGLAVGYRWSLTTKRGRLARDQIVLRLPVYGPIIRRVIISRFCRTLGALLKSGVPVLQSLEVVKNIAGNQVVHKCVKEAESSIKKGEGIARPLQQSGFFPPLVTKMIAVGEEAGAIDTLLEKIADFYEKETEELVTRLTALLEPVLVVGVGGIIGLIILSVMLPVFSIINYIK